jgi:hypothetical protein
MIHPPPTLLTVGKFICPRYGACILVRVLYHLHLTAQQVITPLLPAYGALDGGIIALDGGTEPFSAFVGVVFVCGSTELRSQLAFTVLAEFAIKTGIDPLLASHRSKRSIIRVQDFLQTKPSLTSNIFSRILLIDCRTQASICVPSTFSLTTAAVHSKKTASSPVQSKAPLSALVSRSSSVDARAFFALATVADVTLGVSDIG